jgi:hypothetical protein
MPSTPPDVTHPTQQTSQTNRPSTQSSVQTIPDHQASPQQPEQPNRTSVTVTHRKDTNSHAHAIPATNQTSGQNPTIQTNQQEPCSASTTTQKPRTQGAAIVSLPSLCNCQRANRLPGLPARPSSAGPSREAPCSRPPSPVSTR